MTMVAATIDAPVAMLLGNGFSLGGAAVTLGRVAMSSTTGRAILTVRNWLRRNHLRGSIVTPVQGRDDLTLALG